MSRASQSEGQLGDGLFGEQLVDALAEFLAAEAGEFREQGGGVDLDDQAAGAAADELAVRTHRRREHRIERAVVGTTALAAACLLQDVAQEVGGWSRFSHCARRWGQAPLIGITT
jgi:hypothetical protein